MTNEKQMITRNIPEQLREDFKIACIKEKKTMNDKVIELIKQYLNERG